MGFPAYWDRVLDALLNAVRRHGFRVTVPQVEAELGVAPGALTQYFASTEQLVTWACLTVRRNSLSSLPEALEGHQRLQDRLEIFWWRGVQGSVPLFPLGPLLVEATQLLREGWTFDPDFEQASSDLVSGARPPVPGMVSELVRTKVRDGYAVFVERALGDRSAGLERTWRRIRHDAKFTAKLVEGSEQRVLGALHRRSLLSMYASEDKGADEGLELSFSFLGKQIELG